MDQRRFSLRDGPTTCERYEVSCNRECMRGDARHCYLLGVDHHRQYLRRGRTPDDHEVTTELLLRGCRLGLPESCVEWVLAVGRAPDVDVCQGPVMERACEFDVALGCTAAATYAAEAGDPERARTFEMRACDVGDYHACANLAQTTDLEAPGGVETLRRLLFAACFRGELVQSCVRLAEALEDGPLATRAAHEARVAWEQACRLERRHCRRVPPPPPASSGMDSGSVALYAEPTDTLGAAPSRSGEGRGELSADVIRSTVRSNLHQVEACYEAALARRSGLRGTVSVRFVIEPDGSVSSSTVVGTTLRDHPTESCITDSVATWRFPAPVGGGRVSVTYPFTLDIQ